MISSLTMREAFSIKTILTCLVAWLVPGGGHMLLSRWKRGLLFLSAVLLLFWLGIVQNGQLVGLQPGFFGFLKFFADAATGLPYLIGTWLGWGQGDIHSFGYEYGNTFIYTAGLLNMLLVVDAFDIALGRKN